MINFRKGDPGLFLARVPQHNPGFADGARVEAHMLIYSISPKNGPNYQKPLAPLPLFIYSMARGQKTSKGIYVDGAGSIGSIGQFIINEFSCLWGIALQIYTSPSHHITFHVFLIFLIFNREFKRTSVQSQFATLTTLLGRRSGVRAEAVRTPKLPNQTSMSEIDLL